jgi:hypothetical protein
VPHKPPGTCGIESAGDGVASTAPV